MKRILSISEKLLAFCLTMMLCINLIPNLAFTGDAAETMRDKSIGAA